MPRGLFVVLAALLVTVGCSTSQEGATPPGPVSGVTGAAPANPSTSVASPTPFVTTADEAGAFAFVREYFRTLNAVDGPASLERLKPLRKNTCSCVRVEDGYAEVYDRGGHVDGARVTLGDLIAGQNGPAFFKVTAPFEAADDVVVEANGARKQEKGEKGYYYVTLVREADHWIVAELQAQVLR